jgi:pimeloyl-ACP methyl ester carboxylesterase
MTTTTTRTSDGLDICWESYGPRVGTPLVLVHGLLLSHHLFDRLAGHLAGRWVVAVDVRGHGRSSRPLESYRYSWKLLADDVVAVLDDLGVERAVVGGLSLGAGVALAFAHKYPERTAGMVIEMPVLGQSEGFARVVFGVMATTLRLTSFVLGPMFKPFRKLPSPAGPSELKLAADLLRLHPIAAAALIEGLSASELPIHDRGTLAGIAVPTLVIGHRLDPIHDVADAMLLSERIPEAELVEVAHIGELRMSPARYADIVGGFLQRRF